MNKTYTLPIYKKIGGSYAKAALPYNSNLHLDTKSIYELQYSESLSQDYPSHIFNIKKTPASLSITTNTLAIQATNKYSKDTLKPLYYKLVLSGVNTYSIKELTEELYLKLGTDFLLESGSVYHNKSDSFITIFNNTLLSIPVLDFSTVVHDTNLTIKYLKDKIKLTYKTTNAVDYTLRLKYPHIFGIDIHNTSMCFQPFYAKDSFKHLRHTYKEVEVVEVKLLTDVLYNFKRVVRTQPIITANLEGIYKCEYTALLDNLTYNVMEDSFIYFNKAATVQDKIVITPLQGAVSSDYIYIGQVKKTVVKNELTLNNYKVHTLVNRDMNKLLCSSNTHKNTDHSEVGIGKSNYVYSLQDYVYKRDKYLSVNGLMIFQELQRENWEDLLFIIDTSVITSQLVDPQLINTSLITYKYEGVS